MFKDIRGSEFWGSITEVNKGWSSDKKYHIVTHDNRHLLLRISDIDKYESKKREFDVILELSKLGFEMSMPLDFGTCQSGVYLLLSWIAGEDLEVAIKSKNLVEQYSLGLEAGRILSSIHSVNIPSTCHSWEDRFNKKMDRKIKLYLDSPLKYDHGELFIEYINNNRSLLKNRTTTFQHGDYHIGNMILSNSGSIGIIDFNRYDFGDPWEEFNRIVWDAGISPAFATGRIDGYFDNKVPEKFFQLLALYISNNTLSSLPWAIPFGEEQIEIMKNQAEQVLMNYDYFDSAIPKWYTDTKIELSKC